MRRTTALFLSVVLLPIAVDAQTTSDARAEVVAAIQVHGNTITSTEDVVRASGITVGDRVSERLLADAETRLRGTLKPDAVEVLKRFASISDPTQVLVLIQLDEGPVRVELPNIDIPPPKTPVPPTRRANVVRRSHLNMMFVPILGAQDGYGLTYGVQFAFLGHRTTRRRVVVPASWGGDKRIAVEYQQEFRSRFAPRLRTGAMLQRRTHPFYQDNADRTRAWGRAEWPLLRDVRTGAEVAWQSSSLAGQEVDARSIGADVVIDTRVDPVVPHDAILVRAAAERLTFSTFDAVKTEIDANAFVGLYRGTVLALRAMRDDFSRPAPPFYKSLLGGSRNLRGFRAGQAVGDTLVAASIELRIPATSPLRMARFGYNLFIDAGTTYDRGQRFREQKLERGVGAGVWMTAPLFRVSAAVARGLGSGMRAHIGAGLTF